MYIRVIAHRLRLLWNLEPITISFTIALALVEFVVRFELIDFLVLSSPPLQVLRASSLLEYLRVAATLLTLGAFFEGCGSLPGKIAALLGGFTAGLLGTLYSPGFYSGAPVYLGLIGFNVTGRCIFRNSADLRLVLGFVSLLTPLLLQPTLRWQDSIPLYCGLAGGLTLEGINAIFSIFDKPIRSEAAREINIAPERDFQIVHVSDLHEDWESQGWKKVKELLKDQIKPNLLIVTGDLINTPTRKSILAAGTELKTLGNELDISVVALPGNHDCSFSGALLTVPGAKELFSTTFSTTVRNNRLLIVAFESNANPWLATARIDDGIIEAAPARFEDRSSAPAALRVAMLHHHVMPLPYAADRGFLNQDIFLILRNSSTFLATMARADVDLILHGHRHKASFLTLKNRINFSDRVLTILSAGSSTLKGQEGGANFNLIKVHPNCTVSVERYFYPPGREEPYIDGPYELFSYREQKNRFFRRYRKAQGLGILSEKRTLHIDPYGSIDYTRDITGLEQNAHRDKTLPVTYRTDRGTLRPPTAIWNMPDGAQETLNVSAVDSGASEFRIDLPDAVSRERGADIRIHHQVHFGFSRTRAEAVRLGSTDPHKQVVSCNIRYPLKQLIVTLKRDTDFSAAAVRLRIYYYPSVITSPVGDNGELARPGSVGRLQDEKAEQLERESLVRINDETWEFRVDFPLVGYVYSLEWDTTNTYDAEIDDISRITAAKCKDLLKVTPQGTKELTQQLNTILAEFQKIFFVSYYESLFMELYVPDPDANFVLKCIGAGNIGQTKYPADWKPKEIKPGQGLVGAAFKLGDITRFVAGIPGESYYVQIPGSPEYATCIAIPIFHDEARAAALRGRQAIFQEVGPVMVFFMGSTEAASYLRYFGLSEVPHGSTAEETAKKKSVTDWILRQLR